MAKNINRKRIYGLTIRQWTVLAIAIVTLIIFGCQFCYKAIRDRISPANQNANQTDNTNRGKRRQPRSAPSAGLSVSEATERYLKFGNPSNAGQSDANNFLMVNSSYALSYNRLRATANWVAWSVTAADIGDVERANDFRPDDRLPESWVRITTNDYTGSGFDRGHLCPSKDRSSSLEANSSTFLMTNIAPQTGDLNRGIWERLESYSRDLVLKQGNEIYVIAGMYGAAGKIKRKITIPTNFWKIIIVLPEGIDDVSEITHETRIIAVDMPNTEGVKDDDWRKYRTTIRQIEQKTGLNLFSNLPSNVQNAIKTRVDTN